MTVLQAALAIFVKTPGLSPVKTRLADGIGQRLTQTFFDLSLAAIQATVADVVAAHGIQPYWAVAEADGLADPRWRSFPKLHQGSGDLGDRLGQVFSALQRMHDIAAAIGGDSPQITPAIIQKAFEYLRDPNLHYAHVVGRCRDGGFYLVGTHRRLPAEMWRDIPYSSPATAERLMAKLAATGSVVELETLTDVDQLSDLPGLRAELTALAHLSNEQRAVLEWTDSTLKEFPPTA